MARGRISRFPLDLRRRPYNTLTLPCECVIQTKFVVFILHIDLAMDPNAYLLMVKVSIRDRVSISVRPGAMAVVEVKRILFYR